MIQLCAVCCIDDNHELCSFLEFIRQLFYSTLTIYYNLKAL